MKPIRIAWAAQLATLLVLAAAASTSARADQAFDRYRCVVGGEQQACASSAAADTSASTAQQHSVKPASQKPAQPDAKAKA